MLPAAGEGDACRLVRDAADLAGDTLIWLLPEDLCRIQIGDKARTVDVSLARCTLDEEVRKASNNKGSTFAKMDAMTSFALTSIYLEKGIFYLDHRIDKREAAK